MKCYIPLSELVATVLQSMEAVQFSPGSIKNYEKIFSRLKKLADSKSELFYTPELGRAFIEDSQYARSEEYCYTCKYRFLRATLSELVEPLHREALSQFVALA